jgi:hypothetical protein
VTTIPIDKLYRVGWVDPATDRRGRNGGRSRTAIVVIGGDDLGRVFILQTYAGKDTPNYLMERIFAVDDLWRCQVFGIDATATQLMYAQMINKEARERNLNLRLKPTVLHDDKLFRIDSVLRPLATSGRLFRIAGDAGNTELKEEWTAFPSGQYKDILDSLACAVRLLPTALPAVMREMDRRQLVRYLERSGASQEQIAFRLAQREEVVRRRQENSGR